VLQRVVEAVKTFASVGNRLPFRRGRPFCLVQLQARS
jgi:hypothetical protein